jgi:hypothetical protein
MMLMLTLLLGLACQRPVALPPPPSPPAAEVLWARRDDPAALQEALSLYARAAENDPDSRWLQLRLTRGWVFQATYHSSPDASEAAWESALRWGESCLALNTEYSALRQKERESEQSATRSLTAADVPCAYWMALAWDGWLSHQGTSTRLLARDTSPAYIERVSALEPTYHYSAVARYWGSHYAQLPPFAGRDLAQSRQHFTQARTDSPGFLTADVDMARHWAVTAGDRETFVALLEGVLAADPGTTPDVLPENRAARALAQQLLARQDDLFPR